MFATVFASVAASSDDDTSSVTSWSTSWPTYVNPAGIGESDAVSRPGSAISVPSCERSARFAAANGRLVAARTSADDM